MRARALLTAAVALACLGIAVASVRVARHYRGLRAEVGRIAITRLTDRTEARLESLRDTVFVTYYVTRRDRMPSHLRRLETEVTGFLQALKDASDGKVDFQIVDPDDVPDLANYAAKRRVSPIRVRDVRRDSWSFTEVWSSLTIAYGPHQPAEINGVTPEHVPRLQTLLVEQLDAMEQPTKPVVALAPKSGYFDVHSELSQRASVVRVDFDGGEPIPREADAFLWMDPTVATPNRLRALDLFLESGRSAIVAGSEQAVSVRAGPSEPQLEVSRTAYPAADLLAEFGLRPIERLVCDKFGDELAVVDAQSGEETQHVAPFLIRCIAPNQDWVGLRNQPNGNLFFGAPTCFEIDSERLLERGATAKVLATTSDETWTFPVPRGPVPLSATAKELGERAPKLALGVMVEPDDPWQGPAYFFAASTPFQDGLFKRENAAHWRLLRTLTDNALSPERLVLARVNTHHAEPLPELSPGTRLAWRACVIALAPLLLAALALWRGALGRRGERREVKERGASRSTLVLIGALGGALVATGLVELVLGGRVDLDLTADGRNRLAPGTVEIASAAGDAGAVRVEAFVSDPSVFPPDMRQPVGRLFDLLRDLARAGAELDVERVRPEELDEGEQAALELRGVDARTAVAKVEEITTVRSFWSTLVLSRGDRSTSVHLRDARSFEDLEFKLAFALWRLNTGETPRIAMVPDVPRMSAAEAYEWYQMQGLFSPMGHNVNTLARAMLEDAGFEVLHVEPRKPEFPEDMAEYDLLLWLQPRRPVTKLMDAMTEYLAQGGDVVLAAQHFRFQSRQYRGNNAFEFKYWPQPQSPDVSHPYPPSEKRYYLDEIGVHMPRELFFDELFVRALLPVVIVGRGSARDWEEMELAMPFLVRAAASNFTDHPLMAGVGDQALLYANWFDLDAARLAELGLEATPLIRSSREAWSHHWEGGFLTRDEIYGYKTTPHPDHPDAPRPEGQVPLAVLVEGQFPLPDEPYDKPPVLSSTPGEAPSAEDEARAAAALQAELDRRAALPRAPGRLVLFANSEAFNDQRFDAPEHRADHLLLNAVAGLALPPELAEVATRRPVARGFDWVEPATRVRWRALVLALVPALLALFGIAWRVARRGGSA